MGTVMNWKVVYVCICIILFIYIYISAYYVLSLSLYFSLSLSLCAHICVNYYNLAATSLESWLVSGIIPKWPYFRRRVDNVPRAFVFFYFVFNILAVLFKFVWLRLCFLTCERDFFLLRCGVWWDVNAQLKLIPVLMLWWWGWDGVGWGRVEIDSSVDATVMMW